MDTLLLKVVVTPALIGAASLAGRRWGHQVSGWLVGLPLTSGPVAFFLALDHGPTFAAAAAAGSLAGTVAEAAFCLAYAYGATRSWWLALAGGWLAFAALAAVLQFMPLPLIALAVIACATLAVTLRLMPAGSGVAVTEVPPRWDLPARMAIATTLVLLITGAAPTLGARASGVLATFPLYAAILTVFAHRAGAAPAVQVLRGLLLGLFAFAAFFVILGTLIGRLGVFVSFAAAIATALAIQTGSLVIALSNRPRGATARRR